jgi:hypothetical protein
VRWPLAVRRSLQSDQWLEPTLLVVHKATAELCAVGQSRGERTWARRVLETSRTRSLVHPSSYAWKPSALARRSSKARSLATGAAIFKGLSS